MTIILLIKERNYQYQKTNYNWYMNQPIHIPSIRSIKTKP